MYLLDFSYIYLVNRVSQPLSNLASMDSQSSASSKFASLMQHKRNPDNEAAQQRRLSHSEMQPKSGFFGSMWNRYAYLVPSSPKETMND